MRAEISGDFSRSDKAYNRERQMMIRLFCILAVLFFASPVLAEDEDPCREKYNNDREAIECLDGETKKWEKRLNAAYEEAVAKAEGEWKERLPKAQEAWLKFREANYMLWGAGPGSMFQVFSADSRMKMTKDRAFELEAIRDIL